MLISAVPLVFTGSTLFPFVVGKALYSRLVIEIVVAAWVALAAVAPAYRPRRSTVLLLLAAGLAVAATSAVLGVSPQRSFWSNYERMQGILDSAHWAALALVGACVLRTREHWAMLLHCNLAVGVVVACFATFQHFGLPDFPFYGDLIPAAKGRVSSTFGNPIYLAVYATLNAILAAGLLLGIGRSPRKGPSTRGQRARKRRKPRSQRGAGGAAGGRVLLAAWLAACVGIHVWVALLAGARGPLLGAVIGAMAVAFAWIFLARGRSRVVAAFTLAGLVVLGSVPFLIGALAPPGALKQLDLPIQARRTLRINIDHPTVQSRLTAWRAGVDGFTDRPVFGWGPGNYMVPFARHGEDWPTRSFKPHDYAHNTFVEKLATEGAAGAALYLAVWVATFIAIAKAVWQTRGRERGHALAAGAALVALFTSEQTLFPMTVSSMHYALLLAFTASREMRLNGCNAAGPPNQLRSRGPWALAAGAVWCLAGAGAWTASAVWDAAVGAKRAVSEPLPAALPYRHYDRAIRAFEPMASEVRLHALSRLTPQLATGSIRLTAVLEWIDAQATAAVAAEPRNWRLRHAIAQFYAIAAEHDPSLIATAQVHADALFDMTPKPQGVLSLIGTPGPVPRVHLRAIPEGVSVDWPPVPGALTYRLSVGGPGDRAAQVVEGMPTEAVVNPGPRGDRHIRLQACLGRGNCSQWSDPVPLSAIAAPPDGSAPRRP